MEENQQNIAGTESTSAGDVGASGQPSGSQRGVIIAAVVAVILLAILIFLAVLLVKADPETTSQIRDIFIIFMALESLVIGAALVILIVQVAILTNLLQSEIKPILDSTNDTVNTLRGTVSFLSDNAVQPVIRANSYVAGVKKLIDLIWPGR